MRLPTIALLIVLTSSTAAQSPTPRRFEVVSVRMNRSGQPFGMGPVLQPGGRVRAVNLSLRDLIRSAYGLEENQLLSDAPLDASYDIDARTTADATVEEAAEMLRVLLADRFGLEAHGETRRLPVYTLVRVSESKLGAGIRSSGPECAPLKFPGGDGPAPPPPPPPPPGMEGSSISARPSRRFQRCPTAFFPGGISTRAVDMPGFASALALFVRRPVIDQTELRGDFDIDIHYAPDYAFGPDATPPPSSAPSLPTALREQLGLRLESSQAPIEVLVIDRVRRPTEN